MCGIGGIVNFNRPEDKEPILRRMLGLIRHRGPDAFGIYMNGPVGLASARLSIIDLQGGDQPIANEDRTVWIVYNGEVFNYPELRAELKSKGHRFSTRTDTEVLVHLYEEHGPEMFEKLNGQFAFALWDQNTETLLLARDRLGIRPLFYHAVNRRVVFGSEIKAIFADGSIPRMLDRQTLGDIFTCWSAWGAGTCFRDVRQIPAGHFALFSKQGLTIRPYWQLLSHKQGAESSRAERPLADWTEEFNHLVYDATRIRLRADVPVGAYLSGGLDSTFTSALVKRNFNNLLWTFSIRFSDDRFDETSYQEKAVETLKTNHQSVVCTEKTVSETFPDVIWHTETPILRTAPAPLYQLSRLVRDNHFKVVITGEGADEIFAGYNIFKEDRIRRFWARSPESKLRPLLLQKLYPYIFSRHDGKGKAFLTGFFKKGLTEVRSPAYSHILRWQNTAQLKGFLTAEIQQETGDLHHFIDRYVSMLPLEYMTWDPLTRAQFTEISIFLSNYLLSSQGDRMTMAHSVEGRYPFLDHRLVEFAFRLPSRYRLNGLNEKFLLKQAAKDILPSTIVQRPKQPYRAPISRCFLGANSPDYVHELLSESALRRTGYFDPGKVSRFLAKCRRQDSNLLSERENMALAGMLSTQLVDHLFIRNFPGNTIPTPDGVKISAQ